MIGAALVTAGPARAQGSPSPVISFVTVHAEPDGGELRRETPALVEVPTPLRIDRDLLPDVIARVTVLTPGRVAIVVDRLPLSRAALPASLEVVARDPTGGDLGRQRVAAGFDARGSRLPRHYEAALLLRVGGDPRRIAVEQEVVGAGEQLATTAALFDPASGGRRLRPQRLAVDLSPVPSTVRVDATLARPRIAASVRSSRTTTATIDAAMEDGAADQTLHARAERLPARLTVEYDEDATGRPAVSYEAGERIERVTARVRRRSSQGRTQAIDATVTDLPERVSLAMTGPRSAVLSTSAPIGRIDVAVARNRDPAPVAGATPGLRALVDGAASSFALRLDGLRDATVDARGPIHLDATIAPQRFGIDVAANGRTIRGTIVDLPPRPRLRVDLPRGAIDYTGATIRRIAFVARGRFGRLRRIAATIDGLPTNRIRFAHPRGRATRVDFRASRPLGAVDIVASDGTRAPPVPAGRDSLTLRDAGGAFVARARVSGVRRVSLHAPRGPAGPTTVTFGRSSPRPIAVAVRLASGRARPLVLTGLIRGLPDAVRLLLERERGLRVAYDASGPLTALGLRARGGALGRALRLDARGLPRRLRIGTDRPGGTFQATAGAPVGSLSIATATSGTPRPVAGGRSGIRVTGGSGVAVRVRGLRRVTARARAPFRLDATLARQPFDITVDRPGLHLTGTIADLPRRIRLGVDLPNGTIAYSGHGERIARIALAGRLRPTRSQRARRVAVRIRDFPSARLRIDRRAGAVGFSATRALGEVDVTASDGTALPRAPRDRDVLHYRDLPGAYALHARLTGLRHVAFSRRPARFAFERAGRRRIDVDVRTAARGEPLAIAGHVAGLPRAARVRLDPGPRVGYRASDRLRALHLTASGGPLRGRAVRLDLAGLPRRLDIDVSRGDRTIAATADAPVGSLSVALARRRPRPVANGRSGIRAARGDDVALRVRGLQRLRARTVAPFALDATLARQPFDITVDRPGLHLRGTIADLPRRVGLDVDLPRGAIAYDGHGERIARIEVEGELRRTAKQRARKLGVTVTDLPSARIRLARRAGGFELAASRPLGLLEVRATDGTPLPRLGDGDGIYYRDVRGSYKARIRVRGLRRIAYASRPAALAVERAARGRIDVDAVTRLPRARPLAVNGHLDGLPRAVRVEILGDDPRTGVAYRASDRLAGLHLSATGGPLRRRAVRLDVRDLPRRLRIDSTDAITATADEPVGSLSVAVAADGRPRPVAGGRSGLRMDGDEDVALRLRGLQHVSARTTGPLELEARLARQPLRFSVRHGGRRLTGLIADTPRHVELGIGDGAQTIRYDGHGETVDRLAFDLRSAKPVLRAHRVRGSIRGLPSGRLVLRRGKHALSHVDFTAERPIGRIDVLATERGDPPAPRPGRDRILYDDRPGRYVAHVRISGLRRVALDGLRGTRKTLSAHLRRRSSRPVDLDVRVGRPSLAVTGALARLPSDVRVRLDTGGVAQARYVASGRLGRLRLEARDGSLPARLTRAVLDVRDLPRQVTVAMPDGCRPTLTSVASGRVGMIAVNASADGPIFGRADRVRAVVHDVPAEMRLTPDADRIEFRASEPIGRLRLDATDARVTAAAFPAGDDGVLFHDLPGSYAARVQMTNLQRVRIGGEPFAVGVTRPGRRRLHLDARIEPDTVPDAPRPKQARGGCVRPAEPDAPRGTTPAMRRPITVSGHIDGMPDRLDMTIAAGDGFRADYDASGPLDAVSLQAQTGIGGIRGRAKLDARDVPARMWFAIDDAPCAEDKRECGRHVSAGGSAPIGVVEAEVATDEVPELTGDANRFIASIARSGAVSLAVRLNGLESLEADISRTPTQFVLQTAAGDEAAPLRIHTTAGKRGSRWRGEIAVELGRLPRRVELCFDRGPFCRKHGPKDATVSARLETVGRPLRLSGTVCFRRETTACRGRRSAFMTADVALRHLEVGLRPSIGSGFLFVDTDRRDVDGELGYFSAGKQRACFRLPDEFWFLRRMYFRRPAGTRSRNRAYRRSITLLGGKPSVRCRRGL